VKLCGTYDSSGAALGRVLPPVGVRGAFKGERHNEVVSSVSRAPEHIETVPDRRGDGTAGRRPLVLAVASVEGA
jgi:hypothetical protein